MDVKKECTHQKKSIIVIDGFAEWEVTEIQCSVCKCFEHEGYDYKKQHKNQGNKHAVSKVISK